MFNFLIFLTDFAAFFKASSFFNFSLAAKSFCATLIPADAIFKPGCIVPPIFAIVPATFKTFPKFFALTIFRNFLNFRFLSSTILVSLYKIKSCDVVFVELARPSIVNNKNVILNNILEVLYSII